MNYSNNKDNRDRKFPFSKFILGRFHKWTGIKDDNVEEALIELTGDTYHEMRRLVSQVLDKIEKMVEDDVYPGYLNGKPLTTDQRKCIREIGNEDLKAYLRVTITDAWNDILDKQKYGIDKLGLALKPYLKPNEEDNDVGTEQSGSKS